MKIQAPADRVLTLYIGLIFSWILFRRCSQTKLLYYCCFVLQPCVSQVTAHLKMKSWSCVCLQNSLPMKIRYQNTNTVQTLWLLLLKTQLPNVTLCYSFVCVLCSGSLCRTGFQSCPRWFHRRACSLPQTCPRNPVSLFQLFQECHQTPLTNVVILRVVESGETF